jgi:hypothetical protein
LKCRLTTPPDRPRHPKSGIAPSIDAASRLKKTAHAAEQQRRDVTTFRELGFSNTVTTSFDLEPVLTDCRLLDHRPRSVRPGRGDERSGGKSH